MSSSEDEDSGPDLPTLDISDDQHYRPIRNTAHQVQVKDDLDLEIPKYGSDTIRHSLPAYDLWRPLFPSFLSDEKFQIFHRPKLRHYNTGPQALTNFRKPKAFPVKNLAKELYRFQKKLRYRVINAINQGMSREAIINKYLLIHQAKDLTAKEGELFLFEYIEEFPPVLSQVGMAANIKSYKMPQETAAFTKMKIAQQAKNLTTLTSKSSDTIDSQKQNMETDDPQVVTKTTGNYKIGFNEIVGGKESKLSKKQLYYNQLKPGSTFLALENNMYRAPIFEQEAPYNDFLVIRTRNSFYIRAIKNIFTTGQVMPLVAIPEPTEAAIQKFRCNLSNLYLHKLFRQGDLENSLIDFGSFAKLFPDYGSGQILRKRMRHYGAISKRFGGRDCFLRGNSKYGCLSLREQRRLITPEQYCLNMHMLAARERLKRLNYTESMILPANDAEYETEVLAAPWCVSKAVMNALAGRCYLDFKKHLIDPTGPQREGFSCVAWSRSPTEDQQNKEQHSSSTQPNISQDISQIPTANPLANKIKREKLERLAIYQREAQIIAEVQNYSLSSKEVLSDIEDDGEDEEEDEDENLVDNSFNQELKTLNKLVMEGKTMQELDFNKEEEERFKLMEMFNSLSATKTKRVTKKDNGVNGGHPFDVTSFKDKILKITRTYDSPEGRIQRTELVRDPKMIALYIKQKKDSLPSSPNMECKKLEGKRSNADRSVSQNGSLDRRKSFSLDPSELCRADGIVLTISKRVLDSRAMRKSMRNSRMQEAIS